MTDSAHPTTPSGAAAPVHSRAILVWAGVTGSVVGLGLTTAPVLAAVAAQLGAGLPVSFAELLVGCCAATAMIAAAWLWMVTTDVVLGILAGRAGHGRRPCAGAVRSLVLLACGAAALGSTTTAAAAAPPSSVPAAVAADARHAEADGGAGADDRRLLDGLPLPDRPTGSRRVPEIRAPAPSHDSRRPHEETHRVRPGDCLWTIAEQRLGQGATTAEIATYWRRIHALNTAVIGPDPDLVRPGQLLLLPPLT